MCFFLMQFYLVHIIVYALHILCTISCTVYRGCTEGAFIIRFLEFTSYPNHKTSKTVYREYTMFPFLQKPRRLTHFRNPSHVNHMDHLPDKAR